MIENQILKRHRSQICPSRVNINNEEKLKMGEINISIKELYELHKGQKTKMGVICGYNESKKYLIVESKNGWSRKNTYDEIFSEKNSFMYITKNQLK